MKTAIISDIHGNLEALEAVLAEVSSLAVQRLVCLGDIVGYGANPRECLGMLADLSCETVMGNHDYAVCRMTIQEAEESGQMTPLRWTRQQLTDDEVAQLSAAEYQIEVKGCCFVHGSPHRSEQWPYILEASDAVAAFGESSAGLIFVGHSHVPSVFKEVGVQRMFAGVRRTVVACASERVEVKGRFRWIINPGSVGQPRDGNWHAAYGVYDDASGVYELHRVPYDVERAVEKIIKAGLGSELAERLKVGR